MYNIKLEDIIKKYPFMYEIDGKIYHIGAFVFKECHEQLALKYFSEYQAIINRIDRNKLITHEFSDNEVEDLVYYFRKVKSYSEVLTAEEALDGSNKRAIDFINTLSENFRKELLIQLENYVYTFRYFDRIFLIVK